MVLNGGKLSFFAQIQYYRRISQLYFYVLLSGKTQKSRIINFIWTLEFCILPSILFGG